MFLVECLESEHPTMKMWPSGDAELNPLRWVMMMIERVGHIERRVGHRHRGIGGF
jgi:hypothetical protein